MRLGEAPWQQPGLWLKLVLLCINKTGGDDMCAIQRESGANVDSVTSFLHTKDQSDFFLLIEYLVER